MKIRHIFLPAVASMFLSVHNTENVASYCSLFEFLFPKPIMTVRKNILSVKHRAIFSAVFQMQTDDSFSTNTKHSQLSTIKQRGDLNFDTSSSQMCVFYSMPLGNLIWTVTGNTMYV